MGPDLLLCVSYRLVERSILSAIWVFTYLHWTDLSCSFSGSVIRHENSIARAIGNLRATLDPGGEDYSSPRCIIEFLTCRE